jgi:hypothetical protein
LPNPKYVLVDNDNDPNTPPVDLEGDPATIVVAAPWANRPTAAPPPRSR